MIVFDASGSMAGNTSQGIATTVPRIDEVRAALAEVLPSATRYRRVGLITFGPGPYNQCNVKLESKADAERWRANHEYRECPGASWQNILDFGR